MTIGEITLSKHEKCNLPHPSFKKRGRPRMEEKFFYDPHEKEGDLFMGIDVADINRGDMVRVGSTNMTGYVTKIVDNNTLQINWQITYKE